MNDITLVVHQKLSIMKLNEFYVGLRVKQKDTDGGYWRYGYVREITQNSVIIDWSDPQFGFMPEVEHFQEEFDSIKIGSISPM